MHEIHLSNAMAVLKALYRARNAKTIDVFLATRHYSDNLETHAAQILSADLKEDHQQEAEERDRTAQYINGDNILRPYTYQVKEFADLMLLTGKWANVELIGQLARTAYLDSGESAVQLFDYLIRLDHEEFTQYDKGALLDEINDLGGDNPCLGQFTQAIKATDDYASAEEHYTAGIDDVNTYYNDDLLGPDGRTRRHNLRELMLQSLILRGKPEEAYRLAGLTVPPGHAKLAEYIEYLEQQNQEQQSLPTCVPLGECSIELYSQAKRKSAEQIVQNDRFAIDQTITAMARVALTVAETEQGQTLRWVEKCAPYIMGTPDPWGVTHGSEIATLPPPKLRLLKVIDRALTRA